MKPILVVGSVALDTVKTPFGEVKDTLGGSATYFSYAASFFTKVNMVAVVGEDFPGAYLELLQARSIDLSGLEKQKGKTFHWSGVYGYDLNERETKKVELNVFKNFHPRLSPAYRASPYIFLANIDPDLHLEVIKQLIGPELIVCDTMNIWIKNKRSSLRKALKHVHILILNDSEARELAEESNLIKAARNILRLGPKAVVVKKGEHGAIFISADSLFSVPAYPLESVHDPTGAGDSFAGGFVGYLAKRGEFKEEIIKLAMVYGTVMASFTVEDFSLNRLKRVRPGDIEARFREIKRMTHF